MIKDLVDEYARYRSIGEKALQQVSDEALNSVAGADNNSIATVSIPKGQSREYNMNPTMEKKPG